MKQPKNKRGAPSGNKFAWGNIGGRESKYRASYAELAYKLCLLGHIDKDLAEVFGVAESTINNWKKEYPDFYNSMKAGKEIADGEVAQKLFQRATGYSHPETDIRVIKDKIVQTEIVKHYPPDATSAMFWLKNRQPDKWRDKQDIHFELDKLSDQQLDELILRIVKKSGDE